VIAALGYAAFAAGLLGGVHCAGMCGGIAASLSASSRGPALSRQLGFNAGRIASYAAAGAAAGGVGSLAQSAGPMLSVQLVLFVAANALMILLGLYVAGWGGAVWKTIGEPITNVSSRYSATDLNGLRIMGFNNIELISDRSIETNLREIADVTVKPRDLEEAIVTNLQKVRIDEEDETEELASLSEAAEALRLTAAAPPRPTPSGGDYE